MYWWQSQKSISKRGAGPAAPAAAATGVGGGAAGEVAVQKVHHNLAPKPSFHHGAGKLNKLESIKEDINKKADRFIQMTKARLFNQSKSFRQPPAAPPPAGRDGHLF
ncbi:hypothetical protein E2562_003406 [Oryza meyeriana var. granulata]|uniref:Uncharacterized protein n=1 Tax=Oryza meyeriana var. granulata TaxID=110450 RepID=A0A6G1EDK8_9ORYZ|nr:hypothetical protein E2562_003406 [Oryza meyeriana var. granulata]